RRQFLDWRGAAAEVAVRDIFSRISPTPAAARLEGRAWAKKSREKRGHHAFEIRYRVVPRRRHAGGSEVRRRDQALPRTAEQSVPARAAIQHFPCAAESRSGDVLARD